MYTDGSGATPTRPSSLSKSSSLNWLMGWFGARWLSLLAPAVSIKPFFFNLVFTQREIGKRCRSGTDVAGPVGRRLGPPAVLSHPAPYDSCHALSISPVSSWSGDRSGPPISTAQPIARWVCYCTAQIGYRTSRSEADGIGLIRKPTNRLPPASFGWCAAHVLACPLSLLLTPAATTAGSMGSSVPSHVYNEYAWPK